MTEGIMITIDTIMVNFLPNRSLNLPPIKDPKSNPNIIIVPRNNLFAFLSHTYNFEKYYILYKTLIIGTKKLLL